MEFINLLWWKLQVENSQIEAGILEPGLLSAEVWLEALKATHD